jgi:hypothetical protein
MRIIITILLTLVLAFPALSSPVATHAPHSNSSTHETHAHSMHHEDGQADCCEDELQDHDCCTDEVFEASTDTCCDGECGKCTSDNNTGGSALLANKESSTIRSNPSRLASAQQFTISRTQTKLIPPII